MRSNRGPSAHVHSTLVSVHSTLISVHSALVSMQGTLQAALSFTARSSPPDASSSEDGENASVWGRSPTSGSRKGFFPDMRGYSVHLSIYLSIYLSKKETSPKLDENFAVQCCTAKFQKISLGLRVRPLLETTQRVRFKSYAQNLHVLNALIRPARVPICCTGHATGSGVRALSYAVSDNKGQKTIADFGFLGTLKNVET